MTLENLISMKLFPICNIFTTICNICVRLSSYLNLTCKRNKIKFLLKHHIIFNY